MPEDHIQKQLEAMQTLVELSKERTKMSEERSKMSAQRSYMNAERTLSVWIRTALSLMIFGIAVDRFDLMMREMPVHALAVSPHYHALSTLSGSLLVAFGILMAVSTGIRFLSFSRSYRKQFPLPFHHQAILAPVFALLTALFGIALLIIMLSVH